MIERVSLFTSKRDFFYFFLIATTLLLFSLSLEVYNYKQLTKFDSNLINAKVLKQYYKSKLTKTGKTRTYQVLKLRSEKGFTFYTTASKNLRDIKYKNIELEAWAGNISFSEYMHSFYAYSKILNVDDNTTYRNDFNNFIDAQHTDENASAIYQALFSAKALDRELQVKFSALGVSHLIAISGFHLGILSGLLFFMFKYPYQFLQNKYFPYRSNKIDSFIMIGVVLLWYLIFLDSPPSLLRAYVMLVVGFALYDRGIKILSMQTLVLSIVLILVVAPRLFLNIGFWLSVSGVFYIFLFLQSFKALSKTWQFFLIPFWVYILMLPFSLVIFGNFSIYHPLSILWSSLFTVFYPLSALLHILGFGGILDGLLAYLTHLNTHEVKLELSQNYLMAQVTLSILAAFRREFVYVLLLYSLAFFIYAINQVT